MNRHNVFGLRTASHRRAFTLPELLLVAVLLGILIALLMPVFDKARRKAADAVCAGNLRSYGVGVLALAADNDGLPKWNLETDDSLRFSIWLKPYLQSFPRCPLGSKKDKAVSKDGLPSYGFNYVGNGNLCQYFPKLKGIPAPASRIVLASECHGHNGFYIAGHLNRTIWGNNTGTADPDKEDTATAWRSQYHGSKEHRGLHFFFLDGHIKLVTPTNNDWLEEPVRATTKNRDQGYFYHNVEFRQMSTGHLVVP